MVVQWRRSVTPVAHVWQSSHTVVTVTLNLVCESLGFSSLVLTIVALILPAHCAAHIHLAVVSIRHKSAWQLSHSFDTCYSDLLEQTGWVRSHVHQPFLNDHATDPIPL